VIVAILIAAGGFAAYYITTSNVTETAADAPEVQTSVARQGEITVSATGAGTVIAATEIELSFGAAGILEELLVHVGDDVHVGSDLARLQDTNAQQSLTNAELQLLQTTMQTDGSATETGISYDDIAVEQAQINLELAQAELDDLLNWEPDEEEVALAEANLKAAEASYSAAVNQEASTGFNNQVSKINLEQAERDLANAQGNYNTAFDQGREWETFYDEPTCREGQGGVIPCTGETFKVLIERERESATNGLVRAQDNLAIAQANYNGALAGTSYSNSISAQSSIVAAEQAVEGALSGPTEDEVRTAETAVRQAELSLLQAQLNRESNAVKLAQDQLNVDANQLALEETTLVAPVDGTVMAVNAAVGESVSGPVIVLADLEQPLVEVYIDETDLDTVGMGHEVEVVFDALPDDTFVGHVVQVDPMLSDVGGVSVVRAVVQLDSDSFAKPQTLPVGLNATVEVIGGRAQNAVLVPVEALREISPGKYAVFVMEDNAPQLRFVDVGLMDFSFAEILSGLESGETVTTGIVETN
jgi:multidrug efflux pump subunit AcrA (membrane-fusion protein)